MAYTYTLSDTEEKNIVIDLMGKIARLVPTAKYFELGETFETWMLERENITTFTPSDKTMVDFAKDTQRLHHQIFEDDHPKMYARSKRQHTGHLQVVSLLISDLADDIDTASIWIDENIENEFNVRLLSIPAHYIHAFWLTKDGNDERFYLVQFPSTFKSLKKNRLYNTHDFLNLLQTLPFEDGLYA